MSVIAGESWRQPGQDEVRKGNGVMGKPWRLERFCGEELSQEGVSGRGRKSWGEGRRNSPPNPSPSRI